MELFITHVSLEANTFMMETGISMDPYTYKTQRNLSVQVKATVDGKTQTASIRFAAGIFLKCDYHCNTPYSYEAWEYMGELSDFIKAISWEYGAKEEDSQRGHKPMIAELLEIQPEAFRL
jgi:folate-dependent tRNA-U54 methylase TrmFO/GidA